MEYEIYKNWLNNPHLIMFDEFTCLSSKKQLEKFTGDSVLKFYAFTYIFFKHTYKYNIITLTIFRVSLYTLNRIFKQL